MRIARQLIRACAFAVGTVFTIAVCLALEPPVRIMPLGDSLTEGETLTPVEGGYRNQLYGTLTAPAPNYRADFLGTFADSNNPTLPDVDHQGKGGARTVYLQANLGEWLNRVEDPDVVLLLAGTNDIWQNYSVSTTLTNLTNLIGDIATARPFAKIIVSNLPQRIDSTVYENRQLDYNAGIPGIVADQVALGRQVTWVDMHSVLTPFDYSSDGVHPSTPGYNKMAGVWAPAIAAVISPQGTANPPVIARAVSMDELTQVSVVFSKPVADDAVNLANFSLSGGLTISGAVLDAASKRTITLTTSPQTPGLLYTLTVSGVRDRTMQQTLIAPQSKVNFYGRTVINGGFENGYSGWTQTGNQSIESGAPYLASEGGNMVGFNGGNTPPNGILSQTFNTAAGQTYNLSFDVGVLAYNSNQQRLEVTVQGAATLVSDIASINIPSGFGSNVRWIPKTYSFVANSATTTITFRDVSTNTNSLDLLLDKVRLGPANTLAVTSSTGAGANMTISPADLSGDSGGTTGIIRSYNAGTSVTVTAPSAILGRNFLKWRKNGVDMPASTPSITVTMNGNQALDAVYEPNDAPLADAQSVATDEDTALPVTLTGSDVDGDTLGFAVGTGPANGALSGSAPNLTYTPASNFHGSDSFTFTVSDGIAPPVEATVSITVNAVNDAPLADAQSVATDEDTALPVTLTGSDVDGDTLGFAVGTGPANGALSGSAPNLTYTPAANFHGSDSFTFTVSDGIAPPVEATVSITVNAVNDAPLADAQSVATDEDTALPVTLTGSDVDGDTLGFAVGTGPANGALSGSAPNLTYTPASNFHGSDSFTFTVSDGIAPPVEATVSITVNEVGGIPFTEWIAGFDPGSNPTEDPDQDSICNAIEYVIGGNPMNEMDAGLLPSAIVVTALPEEPPDSGHLVFSYRRTHLAKDDALTAIAVEWSTDPAGPWAVADGTHGETTEVAVNAAGAGIDLVHVTIPMSSEGRLFARLKVTIAQGP